MAIGFSKWLPNGLDLLFVGLGGLCVRVALFFVFLMLALGLLLDVVRSTMLDCVVCRVGCCVDFFFTLVVVMYLVLLGLGELAERSGELSLFTLMVLVIWRAFFELVIFGGVMELRARFFFCGDVLGEFGGLLLVSLFVLVLLCSVASLICSSFTLISLFCLVFSLICLTPVKTVRFPKRLLNAVLPRLTGLGLSLGGEGLSLL